MQPKYVASDLRNKLHFFPSYRFWMKDKFNVDTVAASSSRVHVSQNEKKSGIRKRELPPLKHCSHNDEFS